MKSNEDNKTWICNIMVRNIFMFKQVYCCLTFVCVYILKYVYGRFSKNVQFHVTKFYLLEKALNSNWKWFHQTQHYVMNKRDFTEGIEVLRVVRKICLSPPKCQKIACNSTAIATLNVSFVMRGWVKLNKSYPTY